MAENRSADDIQRDIEKARASLAVAVDQLAERTSPKRIADQTKQNLTEKAQSPTGKAVIGGVGALILLLVIRRIRRRRHS
ncbi:MAG TPA: DUF3618 domain-containing protein [Jatrophihabitantaceae bacterium]